MKRKVKKFNEGGKTYDKEDEGIFGGKVKYREDSEGRKYVAGTPNPMVRDPQEQRYYSKDDVKKGLSNIGDKISNFFGGKSDEPKKSTTMPSGYEKLDATEGNARTRKIEDYIKKSEPKAEEPAKPAGKTFLNQEADIDEKPVKKVVAKKTAPKASTDSDFPKDTKSTRMPSGYDKLDLRSPQEKYKPGISKERQEKADKAVYAGWKKNKIDMTKRKSAEDMKYDEQGNAYKRGGKVKSASARADGCAIRGKTRA
jgi:hypothetical protein